MLTWNNSLITSPPKDGTIIFGWWVEEDSIERVWYNGGWHSAECVYIDPPDFWSTRDRPYPEGTNTDHLCRKCLQKAIDFKSVFNQRVFETLHLCQKCQEEESNKT